MSDQQTIDIVRRFYSAYLAREREAFAAMMAPDFSFTSPCDEMLDRAGYFERCWAGGDAMANMDMRKIVEDKGDVFLIYDLTMKDERNFRNSEYLRVENGLIQRVEVYFGNLPDESTLRMAVNENRVAVAH